MPLSDEQIQMLLGSKPAKRGKKSSTGRGAPAIVPHARPIQFGPLKYYNHSMICSRPDCRSTSHMKVNDEPYCGTHALDVLASMLREEDTSECNCHAGGFSFGRIHTDDCKLYPIQE